NIDPEEVLKGTLIPRLVTARPPVVAIGVDWPVELLECVESATTIGFELTIQESLTNVGIELSECSATAPLVIRVFCSSRDVFVCLSFVGAGAHADFSFAY